MWNRWRILCTKFRVRLFITVLLIVALSLCVSFIFVYRFVIHLNQRNNERNTIDAFAKVEDNIEWMLNNAINFSTMVQLEPDFLALIHRDYANDTEANVIKRELIQSLDRYHSAHSSINAVIFFQSNGQVGGTSMPRSYFFESKNHPFYQTKAYQAAIDNPGQTIWLTDYLRYYYSQSEPLQKETEKDIMIAGIRSFRIGNELKPSIVLLVSIDEPSIRRFYEQLAEEDTSIVLLNESGKMFSGMPFEQFGEVPGYVDQIRRDAQFGSFTYPLQEECQLIYYHMKLTNWTLIKAVPTRIYRQDMQQIGARMLQIGIITMLLLLIFMAGSIVHYTKPIEELTRTMKLAGEGQLSVAVNMDTNIYEIKSLSQAFHQMLQNLQKLIERVQRVEAERARLEIETLQNQLKPHFLFNTITSIRWMATFAGADGVSDALVTLIRLLRPVYDSPAVFWPLSEEIDFLTNYCALMKMRYGKDVSFQVEIAPEDQQIMLPRFLLQPSAENSFEHAMQGRDRLTIKLACEKHDASIVLLVSDDGIGIPPEKREQLMQFLQSDHFDRREENEKKPGQRRGIGLLNCHRRLKLLYGECAGIEIHSGADHGTVIAFHIPFACSQDMAHSDEACL